MVLQNHAATRQLAHQRFGEAAAAIHAGRESLDTQPFVGEHQEGLRRARRRSDLPAVARNPLRGRRTARPCWSYRADRRADVDPADRPGRGIVLRRGGPADRRIPGHAGRADPPDQRRRGGIGCGGDHPHRPATRQCNVIPLSTASAPPSSTTLKPMPREEFKEIIVGPAARATEASKRLVIKDNLVARLLEDVGEGADTLPLVALTLSRLYADYGGTGEISASDYEAMGGMADVVNNAIDELLNQHPGGREKALELLRPAFYPVAGQHQLAQRSGVATGSPRSDLPKDSRPLIDAFVTKRLLVRDDERDGHVVVEVALESLLRQWDALVGWLADERLNLKIADDIERNAAAWEHHWRSSSWLFTGTRLDDAEKLSTREGFSTLLADCRPYLGACRGSGKPAAARRRRVAQRKAASRRGSRPACARKPTGRRTPCTWLTQTLTGHGSRRDGRDLGAAAAIYGVVTATQARKQANERTRDAIAVRLTSEARAILGGDLEGGDIQAVEGARRAQCLPDRRYRRTLRRPGSALDHGEDHRHAKPGARHLQ